MRGLDEYTASWGPEWTFEVRRLVEVDGHQVAWVDLRSDVPGREHMSAGLLCDCDLAVTRNGRTSVLGEQGLDPHVCRYRRAAKLLRALKVRDELRDPRDPWNDKLPEQLVEIVHRGYGGEWVGQDSSDGMWLQEIEPIWTEPLAHLHHVADRLLRDKRLGLSGSLVSPWSERFEPRDDPDEHLDDTRPPDRPRVNGRLEMYFETGTEGSYWALQEHDRDGYDGLHLLATGDWLEILDDDDTIAWQGYIRLRHYALFSEDARGRWIHADQRGIDRDTWAGWFLDDRRAMLIPASRPGARD